MRGPPSSLPPALLFDAHGKAGVWGAIDHSQPIEGIRPPCILQGPGAQIATGLVPAAGMMEEKAAPVGPGGESLLTWTELRAPLITEDGWNVPVLQEPMPPAGAACGYRAEVRLDPAFLYWTARRKWMWHRKWMLPVIPVDVDITVHNVDVDKCFFHSH